MIFANLIGTGLLGAFLYTLLLLHKDVNLPQSIQDIDSAPLVAIYTFAVFLNLC